MKQVKNLWLSWRLANLLLLVLIITTAEQVTSQPSDRNSTLMRYYCSMYKGLSEKYFCRNLDTTLSSLRQQLTTSNHAAARTLVNGESVWGLAWCRGYLSTPDCLSCFDYTVDQLKVCGSGNGAHAIYSYCDLRYENLNFFAEANSRAGTIVCDNTTLPQPTEIRDAAEKLFLDLQTAAPRAPMYYAASTRRVASGNATVYAFAQCNLNISQSVCLQCLKLRSRSLFDRLNTTSGRAMDPGCFMRYDRTPFFGQNQTTDLSSLLWDGDSSKKKAIIGGIVGGVNFLLLLVAIFLWFCRSKKASGGQQDKLNTFKQKKKMNMKPVENGRQLASLVVVVVVLITMADQVTSLPTDRNSTFLSSYCSMYTGLSEKYFLSNLNTTLSTLRRQLTTSGYATARTLLNGESVWGLAWCRGYLSIPDCLYCFDYAVDQLKVCGHANGGSIIYTDCQIRYENNNFFAEPNIRAGVVLCDNTTSPQPTEFQKTAEKLLSDLQIAAPRASNYYAASTRRVAAGNATVYAFAQCHLNISQSVCLKCLQMTTVYGCVPKIAGQSMDNGCFMKYDTTPFFGKNQTTDISSLLWDGDSSKRKAIIGVVVGGVSFLLLLLAVFVWFCRSKKSSGGQQDKSTGFIEMLQGPAAYSYKELKVATNKFSQENKLGGGMFGEVYKGTLKNGDVVAIKKTFMTSSRRGKTHFNDELKIVSNVHQRHLIRLLGYCRKGPHLFLVHEYMENGSLDQFLYGDKTTILSWKQRFGIIFGIARGLAYLHEQYHVTIIHRDIKTSNILLDIEFQPKIADFGLTRLLPEDKTHISTKTTLSWRSGYVAPEYANHGHLSEKVDTYSYGVVVLEIISGKRYKDVTDNKSDTPNLLDHAWNLYESGTHLNLVDDKLDPSEYATEDVIKIIEIALKCTQSTVSTRPAMSEVVTLLSDKTLEERPPVRSATTEDEVKIQVSVESSTSDATVSTIQLLGR